MSEYKVSSRAYTKMIFHSAKYPHSAVNGILLANKDKPKFITDAIPLFHLCLFVTPMAEIALIQIEAMCSSSGLQIVGYYAAAENFNESTIDETPALKIADRIYENYSNACLIMINNKLLCMNSERPAINMWQNVDNRWSKVSLTLEHPSTTLEAVSSLLQRGAMKDIIDFDNHLDNPENDWTNEFLNRDLQQLMAMY